MKIDINDIEFKKCYDYGEWADEGDEHLYYCEWRHPVYDLTVRKAFYCYIPPDIDYITGRKKELKIIAENRFMDEINESVKELENE